MGENQVNYKATWLYIYINIYSLYIWEWKCHNKCRYTGGSLGIRCKGGFILKPFPFIDVFIAFCNLRSLLRYSEQ